MNYESIVFCSFFLMIACTNVNQPINKEPNAFFDLKGYIKNDAKKESFIKSFRKVIILNDLVEEKILDTLSLEKELAIFIQSDINKTAWLDKYQVDSLLDKNGNLKQLLYQAKEEDLRTQLLSVSFSLGVVDSIYIHNVSSSSIANSEQFLTYLPKKGYSIKSRQKINALSEHNLAVDVRFAY